MNYIDINYSLTIFLILILLTLLINSKSFTNRAFTFINLITSLFFTLIYINLRNFDSNDYIEYSSKYILSEHENSLRFEFGYVLISQVFKILGISFPNFYIFIIFLFNYIIINSTNLILRQINVNNIFIFPLLFYCSLYLNFNFIILRTFIACALIMAMIYYAIKNSNIQYIYLILAISFHYLVIPVIIIVYAAKFISSKNLQIYSNIKLYLIIFILIILSLYFNRYLSIFYINLIDQFFPRFRPYNSSFGGWFDVYNALPTTQIIIFIISFYLGFFHKINFYCYKFILNISVLSLSLLILFPFPKINSRLFIFFLPTYFILFIIFSKSLRIYGIFFIFIISIVYFISNYVR